MDDKGSDPKYIDGKRLRPYTGSYSNSIDGRGRCFIPVRFQELLGERCVLVKGFDPCIYLFSVEAYDAYNEEFIVPLEDIEDEDAEKVKYFFEGSVRVCDIDSQGRITIPQQHLDYAHIEREMENIGRTNRIEIWSKQIHEQNMEDILKEDIKALRRKTAHYRKKP